MGQEGQERGATISCIVSWAGVWAVEWGGIMADEFLEAWLRMEMVWGSEREMRMVRVRGGVREFFRRLRKMRVRRRKSRGVSCVWGGEWV